MSRNTIVINDVEFVFESKEDDQKSVFVSISKKGERDVVYFDMTKAQAETLGDVFRAVSK